MKNLIFIFLMLLSEITYSYANESVSSNLNLAISDVKTFRVGNHLVRSIQYNRVDPPYLEFELIRAPKRALLTKVAVNKITAVIEQRSFTMDFFKSAAVDIENIRTEKDSILFEVGYTAAEHTAPYIYSTCHIDVINDKFSTPVCRILKWGNEEIAPILQ